MTKIDKTVFVGTLLRAKLFQNPPKMGPLKKLPFVGWSPAFDEGLLAGGEPYHSPQHHTRTHFFGAKKKSKKQLKKENLVQENREAVGQGWGSVVGPAPHQDGGGVKAPPPTTIGFPGFLFIPGGYHHLNPKHLAYILVS